MLAIAIADNGDSLAVICLDSIWLLFIGMTYLALWVLGYFLSFVVIFPLKDQRLFGKETMCQLNGKQLIRCLYKANYLVYFKNYVFH